MGVKLPKKLYKHRGYTESEVFAEGKENNAFRRLSRELKAAEVGKSWFSDVNAQNDPYDTAVVFRKPIRKEAKEVIKHHQKVLGMYRSYDGADLKVEAKKLGRSVSWYRKQYFETILNGLVSGEIPKQANSIISCFTTDPNNILMWAYYSRSQTSFSYEFELHDPNALKNCPIPVDYVQERPTVSSATYMKWLIQLTARAFEKPVSIADSSTLGLSSDDYTNMVRALSASKSVDWEREKEWRFVEFNRPDGFYSLGPYKLTGVIFGANAGNNLIDHVRESLPTHLTFSKLRLNDHSFKLDSIPI